MQRTSLILACSLLAAVTVLVLLVRNNSTGRSTVAKDSESVVVYCAASNRAAMEAIRADYQREFDRLVQVQYGGSQTLLASLEVSGTGDLYLPADDSYIDIARQRKLIEEVLPIATMRAVLVVAKGNPKKILTYDDLLRDDVRLVQANPEATAIGKTTREHLTRSGLWEKLNQATKTYRGTVNDAANDIDVGAADAAIVYDTVASTYPNLQAIDLPELENIQSKVSLSVLAASQQPSVALHFARYVAARDRGLKHYEHFGFKVAKGDQWQDVPELSVFAGSMLRPAIDETITAFENREGVRVSRVYNGCGILVAQMKSGQVPDAYFACDKEFMNSVPDLFPDPVDVSQNQLVILVQKGNPHKISSLADLTRPGLRVGIGHEKQCAMGWLTQNTLREGGVQKEIMANVTVQVPTGDMLVNQLTAGSLDAAVAYLSNAAGAAEKLDAIVIEGLQCAVAVQPLAVAPKSPRKQLAQRLFERLQTTESKETFMAEGFRWYADTIRAGEHGK